MALQRAVVLDRGDGGDEVGARELTISLLISRASLRRRPLCNCPGACHSSSCMQPSIIVWDLETVPDLAGFAAANDLVGKSDAEVREAIGDKFPKHIYHSIVCIGALIAHREPD
jgi:hypothetical protein